MNPNPHSNTTHSSISHDKRISHMDPAHLSKLSEYAKRLSEAPRDQKLDVFLSIQKEASQNKVTFSAEDRTILLQVLTEQMTEEEKKRAELIQKLASKLMTTS